MIKRFLRRVLLLSFSFFPCGTDVNKYKFWKAAPGMDRRIRARDMMRENKALTINLSKALAGKEGEAYG